MNAEYVDDGYEIFVIAEDGDLLPKDNMFASVWAVKCIFGALSSSIDFVISEYMDENGFFYGIGEEMYLGNSYAVYPFVIDDIDSITLYYLTPENVEELITIGKTIIEFC